MIYLNDKISTINNKGIQQSTNQSKSLVSKNYIGQDTVSFSGNQDTPSKTKDKNKLTAYIIAGLALVVGGIILAINLKKGKNPLKQTSENIAEGVRKTGKNTSSNISSNSVKDSTHKHSNVSSTTSKTPSKEKAELEKQIKKRNVEIQQAKKELQKLIDDLIDKIHPKDEKTAREALPQLVNYSKKLGMGVEDFNLYLMYLTPENKDFAIKEGIPLIANNIELIKKVLPDSEYSDIPKLLKHLNAKNKNEFKPLLENHKENGTESIITLVRNLLKVAQEHK